MLVFYSLGLFPLTAGQFFLPMDLALWEEQDVPTQISKVKYISGALGSLNLEK
jgi:hypothetical protein